MSDLTGKVVGACRHGNNMVACAMCQMERDAPAPSLGEMERLVDAYRVALCDYVTRAHNQVRWVKCADAKAALLAAIARLGAENAALRERVEMADRALVGARSDTIPINLLGLIAVARRALAAPKGGDRE